MFSSYSVSGDSTRFSLYSQFSHFFTIHFLSILFIHCAGLCLLELIKHYYTIILYICLCYLENMNIPGFLLRVSISIWMMMMLRLLLPVISRPLAKLFDLAIFIPDEWRAALEMCIHKKGVEAGAANCHLIRDEICVTSKVAATLHSTTWVFKWPILAHSPTQGGEHGRRLGRHTLVLALQ